MLTIIHGTDITASRNFLTEEKTKYPEKIVFEATKQFTDIMQVLSGSGLFGNTPTLFLEGFLTEKKASKELEAIADFLNKQEDPTIFLWEPKEVTAKELKLFPKSVVKNFAIPKTVFAFVDSIMPDNTQKMLKLYHDVLQHEDAYYVFAMLVRQIRILLALHAQDEQTISEIKRLAPWQMGKMKKQAHAFSEMQLRVLHEKLFQLDIAQKTGGLTLPLEKELDFFLVTI